MWRRAICSRGTWLSNLRWEWRAQDDGQALRLFHLSPLSR
jgi:hypothetical protein